MSGEKQQQNVAGDGIRKQAITRLPLAAARGMRTVWNSQDGLDPDAPGWWWRETLARAGVTTPGSGSAQVCASSRWEPARGTQSAPEAAMPTAASRGGPPRAAAQGPGSQVLPVTAD